MAKQCAIFTLLILSMYYGHTVADGRESTEENVEETWSISFLQKTFLDSRKEFRDLLEDVIMQLKDSQADRNQLRNSLEDARKRIESMQQNPVPIGFIYVQLSSQPEPKNLWPNVEWEDVTSGYAGLFFRAEGGNASTFAKIQEESSPRLVSISSVGSDWEKCQSPDPFRICQITGGAYGKHVGVTYLDFHISNVEVRPRNQAVRIWKRSS